MQSEVTVTLKNEDSTFKKQFNCYDVYSMDYEDKTLINLIELAKKEWKGVPDETIITTRTHWME